jgi:hypothetical protein
MDDGAAPSPQPPAQLGEDAPATRSQKRPPTHDDVVAVWEAHPDEEYRRDMSHWRGHGRWPDEKWTQIGAATRSCMERAATMLGRPAPSGVLLEWGPGGGANLAAFAGVSPVMFGIDVSAKNLEECQRVLTELPDRPAFHPILLTDDPSAVVAEITSPVDLFVSTAVFQHFPSSEYGRRVMATVAGVLAPGALGCIQIRYDDGTPKYRSKAVNYLSRHVTFTSYALGEFWDLIVETGLQPLTITDLNTEVNYATFCFVDPRTS